MAGDEMAVDESMDPLRLRDYYARLMQSAEDWKPYYASLESQPMKLSWNRSENADDDSELFELPLFGSRFQLQEPNQGGLKTNRIGDLVVNAGGPVAALDWCSLIHSENNTTYQEIAISANPFDKKRNPIGKVVSGHNGIQIWSLPLNIEPASEVGSSFHPCHSPSTVEGESKAKNAKSAPKRRRLSESTEDVNPESYSNNRNTRRKTPSRKTMSTPVSTPTQSTPNSFQREMNKTHHVEATPEPPHSKNESSFSKTSVYLSLFLAHENGFSRDLKWKPKDEILHTNTSSHVSAPPQTSEARSQKNDLRLGILASGFADGSVQIYDIPRPWVISKMQNMDSLNKGNQNKNSETNILVPELSNCVFTKLNSICSWKSTKCPVSIPMSLSWSQVDSNNLFCAFHDGTVAMWKVLIDTNKTEMNLLLRFSADNEPLRSIACSPSSCGENGKFLIITGGHSGKLRFWDVRDAFKPLWEFSTSRSFILSLDWASTPNCILISHDDGFVRVLSLNYFFPNHPQTNTFGFSRPSTGVANLYCRSFPISSINCNRTSSTVVYGAADGSLYMFQLNPKGKIDPRTRATHFFCGGFTKHPSSIELLSSNNKKSGSVNTKEEFPNRFLPSAKSLSTVPSSYIKPITEDGGEVNDDHSSFMKCFASEDISLLKVAWNPETNYSRWLAAGSYGGILRCIFVPEVTDTKPRKR